MGRAVVGLHDVGGRNRHVAGDAGGRDEERAGGVLDRVVGRGVGAVGRQDGRLPLKGAGVAGVGVGQRAPGGVAQLEGLAVGQAHGLDAGDLLLGARVGQRGGLALEGDGAGGHLEGAVDGADGVVARVRGRVELVADDGVAGGAHQGLGALDEDALEALVADEVPGAQRVVGAGERGAVVGLGGAGRGDLDGPGGDAQELLGEDVALVDARDAGADPDRQGVGHVGRGDVGGVGRPRAVGRLVLDQGVVAVRVGRGGGAGRVGRAVVGLHDVGGRNRHVAGDAGGRDEERAGGVLDRVVGRGVGAVGRQDGRLPLKGAGVAGVGVGQRAPGGVAQLEGLAVGQAHGLDAGDLLLGARVLDGLRLALEDDAARGDGQLAGMRGGDDVALGAVDAAHRVMGERDGVRADVRRGGFGRDAAAVEARALVAAREAGDALFGAVVGEAVRRGRELDVLVVGDVDDHVVVHDGERELALVHRRVAGNLNRGLDGSCSVRDARDGLGLGNLVGGANPDVVHRVGEVGAHRPLGDQDVLLACVHVVHHNLLPGRKHAAVKHLPTGKRVSLGGNEAQDGGIRQRHAGVVHEPVRNVCARALARLVGERGCGLLRAKDGLEFDDVIVTSECLGHVKIRARRVQHAFQLPTLEVPVSRFLHIGRPECNHSPRTISVGLRVGRNQVYAVLVEIRDGQLAVVQPLCGERNVCVHRGIGIEQFASGIVVPARKRVAIIGRAGRQLSGCHGPDVKPHGALGTTRCVQPRFIKVVAQSNLLERPLGIYRNIFGRHGHVGKVIGYGALRVGVPALKFIDGRQRIRTVGHDKPGLRDIGLILVRNAATLRAIDIDDVVAIAPIVEFSIGVLVAFRRAKILDGREALNHVAVLGADDKIGGVLGHVFVMLDKVHVPVQERTSLAFVQRLNIVRGSVGTTAIACSSECSAIHRHSALESDIFLVGNLVVSVAVVHGPLRRSNVSAPLLRDSGIYLSARPLFVLECQRIHRTRVIHVDDGRTVTFDGLLGNRLCGERSRATGNSLAIDVSTRDRTVVLAHCSRLLARDTIQRLRLMVGVTVVIGILPPVDDRIANRDSLPVGSQRRIVLRDERRCVDFITGCIEPPLEGIAGASGRGVLKVERRTRVDKLVTHRRTTGGIEGHPDATLDDGVQADRSRLIRHANILGNVDGSIRLSRPSHQVELRAHVVNHAAEVMLCVVADTLGPHDLGSVGIVEIDIETIFIVSVQHDGFGFTDTRLDAERAKHSTTFVVPTCEGLALDNGCLGCHEHVAILHDLLADDGGAVGG